MASLLKDSLLKEYSKLVEFLGSALGQDYEIVLHDLSSGSHRIVALANGHISGRGPDSPMSEMAAKLIAEKAYETQDYVHNYKGLSRGNKILDSSTLFIKEGGEVVGLLCINYDSSRYIDLSKRISNDIINLINLSEQGSPAPAAESSPVSGPSSDSVESLVASVVSEATDHGAIEPERLTFEEKLEAVSRLHEMGVFLLKGAVSEVARQLKTSEPSVYRYLNKIQNKAGNARGM